MSCELIFPLHASVASNTLLTWPMFAVCFSYSASGVGAASGLGLDASDHLLLLSFFVLVLGFGDHFLLLRCTHPWALVHAARSGESGVEPFELSALLSPIRSRFGWVKDAVLEGVGAPDDPGTLEGRSIEGATSAATAAIGPLLAQTQLLITCALLIGAYTALPAYRALCLTAALCTLFLLLFHFALFLPCVALDARRQAQQRCDVPVCCVPPIEHGVDEKCCALAGDQFHERYEER